MAKRETKEKVILQDGVLNTPIPEKTNERFGRTFFQKARVLTFESLLRLPQFEDAVGEAIPDAPNGSMFYGLTSDTIRVKIAGTWESLALVP